MKAKDLYRQLDKDFIKDGMTDVWADRVTEFSGIIYKKYLKSGMGLVFDFADEVSKAFTTVFISRKVLNKILNNEITNAMILTHHPVDWDFNNPGGPSFAMDKTLIMKLKERNISVYNLHHPLDDFGEYSTSKTLADALGVKIEKPFLPFYGILPCVIGTTGCNTVGELNNRYSKAVGHKTKLYQYGKNEIINNRVAIAAGGGNIMEVVEELLKENINVLITGISLKNDVSKCVHEYEKEMKINVIGGTHYSSEKFSMIQMCKYFEKLGLAGEFIEDEPCLLDI